MSQQARAEGAPPPGPECIALAKFLRYNSELKNRVGVVNGKRVEFFKGTFFHLLNPQSSDITDINQENVSLDSYYPTPTKKKPPNQNPYSPRSTLKKKPSRHSDYSKPPSSPSASKKSPPTTATTTTLLKNPPKTPRKKRRKNPQPTNPNQHKTSPSNATNPPFPNKTISHGATKQDISKPFSVVLE